MSTAICFDKYGHHQVLKSVVRKLLSSVLAYVVKYINVGPLDAHVRVTWWVVFSLAVFFAT
jgi:hypothetical protein